MMNERLAARKENERVKRLEEEKIEEEGKMRRQLEQMKEAVTQEVRKEWKKEEKRKNQ